MGLQRFRDAVADAHDYAKFSEEELADELLSFSDPNPGVWPIEGKKEAKIMALCAELQERQLPSVTSSNGLILMPTKYGSYPWAIVAFFPDGQHIPIILGEAADEHSKH